MRWLKNLRLLWNHRNDIDYIISHNAQLRNCNQFLTGQNIRMSRELKTTKAYRQGLLIIRDDLIRHRRLTADCVDKHMLCEAFRMIAGGALHGNLINFEREDGGRKTTVWMGGEG